MNYGFYSYNDRKIYGRFNVFQVTSYNKHKTNVTQRRKC